MNILSKALNILAHRNNPIKYWRSMGAKIGENCEIYLDAYLGSEPYLVSIGNHVRLNSGVQIITHDGGVWVLREMMDDLSDIDLVKPVKIGDNVHIGSRAVIFPGVTIGNNCVIGVNAIVTRDIPDNSVAVGIPARVIESIDDYYFKHSAEFVHTKNMSNSVKRSYLLDYFFKSKETKGGK